MRTTTSTILMIRPVRFGSNPQTAESNRFQKFGETAGDGSVQALARTEFDRMVETLRGEGVEVLVFEDTPEPHTPDSIFPNNWLTTHADGTLITYPMEAENRRGERREDVIEGLRRRHGFRVDRRIDFHEHETAGRILEGTGSLVLDRRNRTAYACLSSRTDEGLLNEWCELTGYRPVSFRAVDRGADIYHTNVMMCIGDGFAVVCLDSIPDDGERGTVAESLESNGLEVVAISADQMRAFAGNMLAVADREGRQVLAMSQRAREALEADQVARLERHARLVSSPIPTIEDCAGGSVRCMMAEIFLPRAE